MILMIAVSLAFAVGGGGGGTTTKTFALEQSFSCPDKLTITASDPNGLLSGVSVEISKYGSYGTLASGQTDSGGKIVFTVSEDGAYSVKGTKSGYNTASLLAGIKACQTEPSGTFYCTDRETLKERVSCIMDLPDDDILNVHFVPEECRTQGEAEKQKCIDTYKVLQTCRIGFEGTDDDREKCIKPKLNISSNIWDSARACNGNQQCMGDLRQKVYTLTKFRIYNLEYKVREMLNQGLSRDKAVDFIAYIEEAKARFNSASTISAKKALVGEIKEKWDEFATQAKAEMGVGG
jgi:hypothetical protein